MKIFRRKLLSFVLLALIVGCGYIVFIRTVIDPTMVSSSGAEEIDDTLARIYENFLHKTKYSYETVLASGTDYSNQERVFVELTKKMKELDPSKDPDYKILRNKMLAEIRKNEAAFKSFYLKVSKTTPEELKRQIESRTKEYDILLESN